MVKRFLTAVAPLAMLICTPWHHAVRGRRPPTYAAAYATYASAIPAFARKYGLRCSACHTAWPELSAFGQRFKDNGYQLATIATRRFGKPTPTGDRMRTTRSCTSRIPRTR